MDLDHTKTAVEEDHEDEEEDKEILDDQSSIFSSEDDIELTKDFDEKLAIKHILENIPSVKIVLTLESQREMGLEIGKNVTTELPWKRVKKETVENGVQDKTPEQKLLKSKISKMDRGELILVGYSSSLSEEGDDTFLVFDDEVSAKEAAELIRKLEAMQRREIKSAFVKCPRVWESQGSELEVDVYVSREDSNSLDVQIQSVYPFKKKYAEFQQRLVDDVRDGYVDLLPKGKFDNIIRRRVDMGIQSAPPRINLEQQTDPTFPTNAWSQYLYELNQENLENQGETEAEQKRIPANVKQKSMELTESNDEISDQVKNLLDTLEFNQIDMYQNDYIHIAKKKIFRSEIPEIQESLCFADMSKSTGRLLTGIDWHPKYSGITVCSYTFNTISSMVNTTEAIDSVQRTVLEPNPVLMWSFDDDLNPKLQLQTPREVMTLSFCPYDENVLIGGFVNGQIAIWDLNNRLQKIESEEKLTQNQIIYRVAMRSFLSWTKEENRDVVVLPAAISALDHSHKGAVTSIQWINRKFIVNETGHVRENATQSARMFATSSLDGNICFWSLDFGTSDEVRNAPAMRKPQKLPEGFLQQISVYNCLDRIFRPTFTLIHKRPITSFLMDNAVFRYTPKPISIKRKIFTRVDHTVEQVPLEAFRMTMTISSYMGKISKINWDGVESLGADMNREVLKQVELYDSVHDGPIFGMDRNPFVDSIFLSFGRTILALWKDDFKTTPILWRKRPATLTKVAWSKNRPSVFFVTRDDGNFEAWDLLAKTDSPCMVETLGGKNLTTLSQHYLSLPRAAVGIGDFNSSLRIILLPNDLVKSLPNEQQLLEELIDQEIIRKTKFIEWKRKWYEENKDVIESRKLAASEAKAELNRIQKELKEMEEIKMKQANEEERRRRLKESRKNVYDLPERLQKKWEKMNFKRLMKVLMQRRRVDQELLAIQTKPLKDLMKYKLKKMENIQISFSKTQEDIAIVRSQLLPVEEHTIERVDTIRDSINELTNNMDEYDGIEQEALDFIIPKQSRDELKYSEVLRRGRQRLEVINQSNGGNIDHRNLYNDWKRHSLYAEHGLHVFNQDLSKLQSE